MEEFRDEEGPYFHRDDNADPKIPPLLVYFREEIILNEKASAAGAPLFDRVVQLRILAAGQQKGCPIYEWKRTFPVDTPPFGMERVDKTVAHRFRKVIREWEEKATPATHGTPIEEWALMSKTLVRAFKHFNVHTVQQLAELPDGLLENIKAPAREWRAKAQAWLADASNSAAAVEARAENVRLSGEVDALKAQVAALLAKQNDTQPAFDRRRKRKGEDDDLGGPVMPDLEDSRL